MKKKDLVSIIIINFNGKNYLEKCLNSLENQIYKKAEIILIDNASTDGSVEFVKKKYPKVKMHINKKNQGFAEANNIGYSFSKGNYILFLNNDTIVSKNFLSELIKTIENDQSIGCVQSKILQMDNKNILDNVGTFLTFTGFLYYYGYYKKNGKKYDKQLDIYSPKGACMLFRKEILEKV